MKILITTPTDAVGRLVVRELLAPEFSVRVIVRDARQLPADVRAQVEVIEGAPEDAATLQDALAGVEALCFCLPPQSETERRQTEQLARVTAQAIREARTRRVVTVFAGVKLCPADGASLCRLQAVENILAAAGAATRHLRGGWQGEPGRWCHPQPPMAGGPAEADLADAALRWLVRRDWSGVARVIVRGPEEVCLTAVSPAADAPQRPNSWCWF